MATNLSSEADLKFYVREATADVVVAKCPATFVGARVGQINMWPISLIHQRLGE